MWFAINISEIGRESFYARFSFYCRCKKITALLLTLESLGFDSLLGFRNSHKQLPNHRAEIILIQIDDIGRLQTTFSIFLMFDKSEVSLLKSLCHKADG